MRTTGLFALGLAIVLWALVAGLAQPQAGSVAGDEPTASPSPTVVPSETVTPTPTNTPTEVPTRFVVYLFVSNPPSPTPTATPSTTPTPTRTNTPVPATLVPLPGVSNSPIIGTFSMVENKPSYATHIEWIKFNELIFNDADQPVFYGVLGVNVEGPRTFFQTSWGGEDAPGGVLQIGPKCYGPGGGICAPSAEGGRVEDHIIADAPGTYRLTFFICLSQFTTCTDPNGGGQWRLIAPAINIVAVDWTPQPPALDGYIYDPKPICVMDLSNPDNIILTCRTVGMRHGPDGGKP